MKKILFLLLLLCCYGCSESTTEVNEDTAQQVYNNLKGTYVGYVLVDNIPQKMVITIANNLQVRQLPLKPILERILTDETQLTEALALANYAELTIPLESMQLYGSDVLLRMEDTNLQVAVTIEGITYQINALFSALAHIETNTDILTLEMDVTELLCNGQSYDLNNNRISYYVDIANKQKEE